MIEARSSWSGIVAFAVFFGTSNAAAETRMPSLHEPLYFDLVRGLGAKVGEVEVNTLVTVDGSSNDLRWSPEVELAVVDGLAFELELPHASDRLTSVKGSVQLTLPGTFDHFAHGVLGTGERVLGGAGDQLSSHYVAGASFGRFSTLMLVGGIASLGPEGGVTPMFSANDSIFYELSRNTTLGFESDLRFTSGVLEQARLLPQIHERFGDHFALQAGFGVVWHRGKAAPFGSLRVILQ